MLLEQIPDSALLKSLDIPPKLLANLHLKLSSITARNMKTQIESQIPRINRATLNQQFIDLQDTVEVEFNKRGIYSKNVLTQLQTAITTAIRENLEEVHKTFQINSVIEKWDQRRRAFRISDKFREIILRGHKDDEDRLIGISYAYLGFTNGVYRFSLQDCYAWERLAMGESVDPEQLSNIEINDVYEYYKRNDLPLFYFHGWDSTIRNAVGHANLSYDDITQKMTFINEIRDRSKKKVSEYEFIELVENYEKILDVYHAVLVMAQINVVSSVCFELARRYP